MAILRVNKTRDYTVMSNYHFREREMSLKAKGLLSLMLSLPDDWKYTVDGLVSICKENQTAINAALNELKTFGYLEVHKVRDPESGRFTYIYDVYEKPRKVNEDSPEGENPALEKPALEKPDMEKPALENMGLYKDTKVLSTKKQNTKVSSTKREREKTPSANAEATPAPHNYGEYQNVRLSDSDIRKLQTEFPEDWAERIEELSEYKASSGKDYKNDLATIRRWSKNGVKRNGTNHSTNPAIDYAQRPNSETNYGACTINLDEYLDDAEKLGGHAPI